MTSSSKEVESAKSPASLHVLIIEDNPDGRDSLRLVLQLYGYQVDAVGDGSAGVDWAIERRPEVALVDIGLPGLNGYEVARRVRQALGDDIFLIACTAYNQPEDRRRAFDAGFDAYLVKPINLDDLIMRLTEVAQTRASVN